MWLHKFSTVIVSHSMTQMDGKQSSAKTSYLNVINLNEFIKNEWKWDTEQKNKTDKLTTQKKPRIQSEGLWLRNMCADKISNTKKHVWFRCKGKLLLLLWPHASKFIALNHSVKETDKNTQTMKYVVSDFDGCILRTEFICVI